ncbi:MAG: hypothetical protein HZB54_01405 [Deltaproteobacteria bacterium]|nr:hypothetical protein [Deltaproteobacteria bacterium]
MQKGIIAYKLSNLGWDVSEHYGDGFDLLCLRNQDGTQEIARKIELKAVDLKSYSREAKNKSHSRKAKSFSQAISPNEIVASTHIIISIFNEIELKGHFVMSIRQVFNAVKKKKTSKFKKYKSFSEFQKAAWKVSQKKVLRRKGNKKKLPRLSLDIGCTFKKFNKGDWELDTFKDKWDNL